MPKSKYNSIEEIDTAYAPVEGETPEEKRKRENKRNSARTRFR